MKIRFPGLRRSSRKGKKPVTAGDMLLDDSPSPADLPRDPVHKVPRPPSLLDVSMFLVLWDRESETYTLIFRDMSSFDLGEGPDAMRYLKRALGNDELYAGRCLDVACNFIASVCEPSIRRAVSSNELLEGRRMSIGEYMEKQLKPVDLLK